MEDQPPSVVYAAPHHWGDDSLSDEACRPQIPLRAMLAATLWSAGLLTLGRFDLVSDYNILPILAIVTVAAGPIGTLSDDRHRRQNCIGMAAFAAIVTLLIYLVFFASFASAPARKSLRTEGQGCWAYFEISPYV